ncbi:MFS transporter [Staphylococcus xylosus]|uniref:CynX/NimT family MFS transporter n=1 Tax=Staphylococcus xylosus TaxID=1288 RepID=UPI002DBD8B98|nr:MFS transporter [Staphylococcus xylosus]MEB6323754.1 MFS transporter [Staphylococcus xylosus]
MNNSYNFHRIKGNWLIIIAIIMVASTLRAPLTSVGPVINDIIHQFNINDGIAGSLITIPLFIFAIISPLVSKVTNYLSMSRTILLSTLLLVFSLILRVAGDFTLFILGTILLGVAIAFGNVLLPSYVKWYFPTQVGIVTGIYSSMMHFTAGLGGGLSIPISSASQFGFRLSLSSWVIFAIISIFLWILIVKKNSKLERKTAFVNQRNKENKTNIVKSRIAWIIAATMGFQAMIIYTIVMWMPSILIDKGVDSSTAGFLFMLNQFSQVPMTFIVPIIAYKLSNQRILAIIITTLFLLGFSFLFSHSLILLFIGVIISGAAMGACFSFCMILFSIKARTDNGSVTLSGFGQSIGYLIGAIGPVLVGYLYDITHSWNSGIVALFIMALLFLIFSYSASKNRVIED